MLLINVTIKQKMQAQYLNNIFTFFRLFSFMFLKMALTRGGLVFL